MMRTKIGILLTIFILSIFACTEKTWDDYYYKQPETINMNVWDAIKGRSDLSSFVNLMVKYKFDTLFQSDNTYTLFVPDNSALDLLMKSEAIDDTTILNYHISKNFILPIDIQGKIKLQTKVGKYSTLEKVNRKSYYDGIELNYESPLYLNGKFFIMSGVALPKLNIYEFFTKNNPYLKNYIDKKDSIILDKVKSRPIGLDEDGNTVYDTVAIRKNLVDSLYFPVSKEFRTRTATFAFPRLVNYENGLTDMAQKLGGNFHDYKDIPIKWQEDILIPHLLNHGTFLNVMQVSDFKSIDIITHNKRRKYNMVNIRGDSIVVNYIPTDPYLCSNGITYDYTNFVIPDSLFAGSNKMEGEWLARPTGANKYAWRKNVIVSGTSSFSVANQYIKGQSNDSILIVVFTKGYTGTYKVQFNTRNLFPGKYRMVVRTNMDYGGIYNIYVNDLLVKTFDYFDYKRSGGLIKSVTGDYFVPTGRYNKFDCYVDNITEYGSQTIRFEYKGPSNSLLNNGLAIDVIEFIPAVVIPVTP
jgi:hypothetical protein